MQLDELVHGGNALLAVEIAGRLREAVIGQRSAEQPEIGVHIPVADAGNVQAVGASILGCLNESFHRFGNGVQTDLLEHVRVDDRGLAVGVQRQAVVLALIEVGGKRRLQIIAGDLRKVCVIAQRNETALLRVGCDVGDVNARHIGTHAGAERGDDHLVELTAVLTDRFDLDVRMRGLPERQHHVQKLGFFRVAVGVPEGQGDLTVRRGSVRRCVFRLTVRIRGLFGRGSAAGHACRQKRGSQKQSKQFCKFVFHADPPHFLGRVLAYIRMASGGEKGFCCPHTFASRLSAAYPYCTGFWRDCNTAFAAFRLRCWSN